jgi:two-component system, NtrC family, response regulator GlrR
MESVAIATVVSERSHAIEDEALAARCATTNTLITADCAAAVERIARRIHVASPCAAFPFVQLAAAALPVGAAELMETCVVLLDAARSGSVLLSDVEDMAAIVQDRWIETVTCLQASRDPSSRVRLIAGTTTSLRHRVTNGAFSERLFYRLNVIHVVAKNGVEETTRRDEAAERLDAMAVQPYDVRRSLRVQ